MSNGEKRNGGPQFRTATLITSAALVGGGCIIALAGLALADAQVGGQRGQQAHRHELRGDQGKGCQGQGEDGAPAGRVRVYRDHFK